MKLDAGSEFAGHRVVAEIGDGSMARLYRVLAADGSPRLLKLPRLEFGSHPACYAGFETERIVLQRLVGPQQPQLFANGDADGQPWLICEDLGSDTLAARLAQAPLPVAEVVRLGAAIATALAALHRQDVVHHDLKPAHVFFRADGSAALIDFGLACHARLPDFVADEAADRRAVLGTPAYVSPEQLQGRRGDPRSDIYALGVLLYALLTGRLPFGDPRSVAAMRSRLYLDCVPPRRFNPDCPDWLQEIVLHCLEPDVAARYGSAAHVATDLRHPEQVAVGERGTRRRRRIGVALRRLLRGLPLLPGAAPAPTRSPAAQLARAPQVLVALDTAHADAALAEALRRTVRQLVAGAPQWRVICATVAEPLAAGLEDTDDLERSRQTETLMALRHWAAALDIAAERQRYVILDGGDAAAALVAYAGAHHIDHIVIGARGSSTLRRLLGSVSARVAAEAPCSVTVVRRGGTHDVAPAGG